MTAPVPRPVDAWPVHVAIAGDASAPRIATDATIATETRSHIRQVFRWRRYGIRPREADRVAVALGVHMLSIWPDDEGAVA